MKSIITLILMFFCGLANATPIVLYDSLNQPVGTAENPLKVSCLGDSCGGLTNNTITGDATVEGNLTVDGVLYAQGLEVDNIIYVSALINSNIVYVGCSDSIQTAINNANSGDTLMLGSCTYAISSGITIDKVIHIVGQGETSTIIDSGVNNISPITSTIDGVSIEEIGFIGTNVDTSVITINLNSGVSGSNTLIKNININTVHSTCSNSGVTFLDAGGIVVDSIIYSNTASLSGSCGGQVYGIIQDVHNTADGDLSLTVKNTKVYLFSRASTSSGSIQRGIRFYNYLNLYPYVDVLNLENSTLEVYEPNEGNGVEALHVQGTSMIANVNNSTLIAHYTGLGTYNTKKDLRCDDGASCYLNNSVLAGNQWQCQNSGTIYRNGALWGNAINLDASPPVGTGYPNGVSANKMFLGTGGAGGNASATTYGTAGVGAGILLTGGVGGKVIAGTTTGTAGAGGAFSFTAGIGGDQTLDTTITNIGGAGGAITLTSGAGGAASSAFTTNTGGAGGSIKINLGQGGVGTTTSGTDGNFYVGTGRTTVGSDTGKMIIGSLTLAPQANLEVSSLAASGGSTTLRMSRVDSSISSNDDIGKIEFYGSDSNLTTQNIFGNIEVLAASTITSDSANGVMVLRTTNLTSASSPTTKIKISDYGSINTASSQVISDGGSLAIDSCGGTKFISSSGNVTTSTTDTFSPTSSTYAGCCTDIINSDSSDSITLDNNSKTLTNGGVDVVLGPGDSARFCASSSIWYQIGATGNN